MFDAVVIDRAHDSCEAIVVLVDDKLKRIGHKHERS